jgi:hypothetical protein
MGDPATIITNMLNTAVSNNPTLSKIPQLLTLLQNIPATIETAKQSILSAVDARVAAADTGNSSGNNGSGDPPANEETPNNETEDPNAGEGGINNSSGEGEYNGSGEGGEEGGQGNYYEENTYAVGGARSRARQRRRPAVTRRRRARRGARRISRRRTLR